MRVLMRLAAQFKVEPHLHCTALMNETVVLYFNKPSTRTRISFETAVARLGGTPIMVGSEALQLGRGETIEDTARVTSRYARAFVVRTFDDEDVRRFAAAARIPVINALTDLHHPLQSLADVFTLSERYADLGRCKIAYLGVGNNVTHSLMEAIALIGARIAVATPPEYAPEPAIVARAREIGAQTGAAVSVGHDPLEAVREADAVYTDAWVSMGDPEPERAARIRALAPYQVNQALMGQAKPDAIFMHCLPDHRGEEVAAAVVDGPQSVVFEQAENRLHTSAAVLLGLLEGRFQGRDGRADRCRSGNLIRSGPGTIGQSPL
jgi:ornithine carbamoyltransferase